MDIKLIIKNKWVQTSAISVVTFVGGGALGYILGKRKVNKEITAKEIDEELLKIEKSLDEMHQTRAELDDLRQAKAELENQRQHLAQQFKNVSEEIVEEEPVEDAEEVKLSHSLAEAMANRGAIKNRQIKNPTKSKPKQNLKEKFEGKTKPKPSEDSYPPTEISTFNGVDYPWNYELEFTTRTPTSPYIIHQDEFINNELEYSQDTLMYYMGDDILSDTDNTPIYNYSALMGELKFGHGSKDPNIVYIRNEKQEMEWEIIREFGSFSQEILGFDIEKEAEEELRHSIQKFRKE